MTIKRLLIFQILTFGKKKGKFAGQACNKDSIHQNIVSQVL